MGQNGWDGGAAGAAAQPSGASTAPGAALARPPVLSLARSVAVPATFVATHAASLADARAGRLGEPSPAQDFRADDPAPRKGNRTVAMAALLVVGVFLIIGVAFLAAAGGRLTATR